MKITKTKVKRLLEKNFGWDNLDYEKNKWFVDGLIEDTISVINDILEKQKNISIK